MWNWPGEPGISHGREPHCSQQTLSSWGGGPPLLLLVIQVPSKMPPPEAAPSSHLPGGPERHGNTSFIQCHQRKGGTQVNGFSGLLKYSLSNF